MADQNIQVHPDTPGLGKKIDTEEVTVGATVVQRQRVVVAGTGAAEIAAVKAASPANTEYGNVTRNIPATATAAALSNVASSVTNVTLLASNANRRMATFYNDSASATLYLKLGATASATSHTVQLLPGGYYELPAPVYTGIVDGLWSAAVGSCRVTEIT